MGSELARLILLGVLHILALPTRLVVRAFRARRARALFRRIAGGTFRCPGCNEVNLLDILGICRRCGFTEYGNRLWCSNCSFLAIGFHCDHCRATIVVFPELR